MAVQAVFGRESDPAQDLLAVAGRRQRGVSRRRLGQQTAETVIVLAGGGRQQGRLGAVEGDERLGEPVPDGLERGKRAAELDAVQGVPAALSNTSLSSGACAPVSPSSRKAVGIATSGNSASRSGQPRSISAMSRTRPDAAVIVLRNVSASSSESAGSMISLSPG